MLEILSLIVLFLYALIVVSASLKGVNDKTSFLFLSATIFHAIFLVVYSLNYTLQSLFIGNNYLFILSFIIALGYFLIFSKVKVKYLESILALICFLLFASSSYLFEVSNITDKPLENLYFTLFHLMPMIFGEAIFVGNIAIGLYYLYRERQIKKVKEITFDAISLEKLKNVFTVLSKLSFILMSLGAISGFIWYIHIQDSFIILDLLVIYFVLSWLIIFLFLSTRRFSIVSLHKQITYLTWTSLVITILFLILRLNAGELLHGV